MKKFVLFALCAMCAMTMMAQRVGGGKSDNRDDGHPAFWGHLERGYRGFAEETFGLAIGSSGGDVNQCKYSELSTTHGYQVTPYMFIGAGFALEFYGNGREWEEGFTLPIYGDVRFDFLNKRITPFFDIRAGSSVVGIKAFYGSSTLGARFCVGGSMAINFGLSCHFQNIKRLSYMEYDEGYYYWIISPGLKLGLEW